jgi:ketosteroid isomerase-like protein
MRGQARYHVKRPLLCGAAAFLAVGIATSPLAAAPEDEVRNTFDHFVAAQNGHDANAVEALLLDSPAFLWVTRGTSVWGVPAAMERFGKLYQGTWHLDPEAAGLKVSVLADGVAQLYVPIVFTIGPSGQPAQPTRFLMNQVLVKTGAGWKISSILPIPAP